MAKRSKGPAIEQVLLSDIVVDWDKRLRPASEHGVSTLIASIEQLGVMKDPVQLRRKRRKTGTTLELMAGGHRYEAALRLGWETIPARVWVDVTDDFARLMEIDDNLAGADLNALELSIFLAERKKVYERLYPETKADAFKGNRHTGKLATDIMSFANSVAEKRNLTDRHIRRLIAAGESLSAWEVSALREAQTPITLKVLMDLANVGEESARIDVVDRLKHGTAKSVPEAVSAATGSIKSPPNKVDDAFQSLLTVWKRAPKAAQRRFVDEAQNELRSMLEKLGEKDE